MCLAFSLFSNLYVCEWVCTRESSGCILETEPKDRRVTYKRSLVRLTSSVQACGCIGASVWVCVCAETNKLEYSCVNTLECCTMTCIWLWSSFIQTKVNSIFHLNTFLVYISALLITHTHSNTHSWSPFWLSYHLNLNHLIKIISIVPCGSIDCV